MEENIARYNRKVSLLGKKGYFLYVQIGKHIYLALKGKG